MWSNWLAKAERFRRYAKEDLEKSRFDSAAFYSHQSVELLLKAFLIKLTGARPLTRSTSELLAILSRALDGRIPESVIRCSEELEQHYVQARYPDARISEYRRWEAERAIECMEVIWSYVQGYNLTGWRD